MFKKQEIKLQNVLFCLFVVLIHLITSDMLKSKLVFSLQRVLFTAVFGFIFLSGLKQFLSTKDESVLGYYLNKAKKILVPYLVSAFIFWFVIYLPEGERSFVTFVKLTLTGRLASHFYFVIAIFTLYLVTPLIKWLMTKLGALPMLILSLAATTATAYLLCRFEYYNILFTRYLFVYAMGAAAALNYDKFKQWLDCHFFAVTFIYIATLCIELVSAFLHEGAVITTPVRQVITVSCMVPAILFFFALCIKITSKADISKSKFITAVDSNSYYIYLYHVLILMLIDKYLTFLLSLDTYPAFAIRTVIVALAMWLMIKIKKFTKRKFIRRKINYGDER